MWVLVAFGGVVLNGREVLMRWSPGCNCCGGTPACRVDADDFSGALGAFTQVSGVWTIISNELTTSSASGILRHDTAHPDAEAEFWVYVKVKAGASGDKQRILVAYTDSTHYVAGEVTIAGSSSKLKIYENSGSGEVLMAEADATGGAGTWHELWVCYTGMYDSGGPAYVTTINFIDWDAGRQFYTVSARTTESGLHVGLGTGDTVGGTVYFDDFDYQKHQSETNPDCLNCRPECNHCLDGNAPPVLKLVISGLADDTCGDCAAYNGTYYVPFKESLASGSCIWELSGQSSPSSCHTTYTLTVELWRSSGGMGGAVYGFTATLYGVPGLGLYGVGRWSTTQNPRFDCSSLSNEPLYYDFWYSWACDLTWSSCLMSAVV